MLNSQRFSFTERGNSLGQSVIMPYVPVVLTSGSRSVEVMALLDTGASVSVLPYELGVELGAVWADQTVKIPLSGNLAQGEARGLIVSGSIGSFSPVLLAFAWTQLNDSPVILGHMNFFSEFNVCFYSHELAFEICLRDR
ncbi:retropepsin-like aspartic protease [Chamaesiphon sp.]|uniref:retropepsin-like aspartic protease n=1 Tax=Chamaesiphon sp. TaxID=2814140 RepID=UPI003593BCBC